MDECFFKKININICTSFTNKCGENIWNNLQSSKVHSLVPPWINRCASTCPLVCLMHKHYHWKPLYSIRELKLYVEYLDAILHYGAIYSLGSGGDSSNKFLFYFLFLSLFTKLLRSLLKCYISLKQLNQVLLQGRYSHEFEHISD